MDHMSSLNVLHPKQLSFCKNASGRPIQGLPPLPKRPEEAQKPEVDLPCENCDGCRLRRIVNQTAAWLRQTGDRTQTKFLAALLETFEDEVEEGEEEEEEKKDVAPENEKTHGMRLLRKNDEEEKKTLLIPPQPTSSSSLHAVPRSTHLHQLKYGFERLLSFFPSHASKERIYGRSKMYSGIEIDAFTTTADFGLPAAFVDEAIGVCVGWFRKSHPRIRFGFLTAILRHCKTTPTRCFVDESRKLLRKVTKQLHKEVNPEMTISSADVESVENQFTHDCATKMSERQRFIDAKLRSYEETSSAEIPVDCNPDLELLSRVKAAVGCGDSSTDLTANKRPKKLMTFVDKGSFRESSRGELEAPSTAASSQLSSVFVPTRMHAIEKQKAMRKVKLTRSKSSGQTRKSVRNFSEDFVDLIRKLPVHLAKRILNSLNLKWILNCAKVSQHWRSLALEVMAERKQIKLNQDSYLKLLSQGAGCFDENTIRKGTPTPNYAAYVEIPVPHLQSRSSSKIVYKKAGNASQQRQRLNKGRDLDSQVSFKTAFHGLVTRKIILEERNVFCTSASPLIIFSSTNPNRVVHTESRVESKLMAIGEGNAPIKIISAETGQITGKSCYGHAGTVRCLWLMEEEGLLLSGSYDTTIRMWRLKDGKCQQIYMGHSNTVNCLFVGGDILASGSSDRHCRIWNLWDKSVLHRFPHSRAVTAVRINADERICVVATTEGLIKVWNLENGDPIKKLEGHKDTITGIKMDKWHLVSGSMDSHVLVWSMQGAHQVPVRDFKHPSMVYCVEFMYLRILTGCGDGRVRVFDLVRGICLKTIRCTYTDMPVLDMFPCGLSKLIVHLQEIVLVLSFEDTEWNFQCEGPMMEEEEEEEDSKPETSAHVSYAMIRARRMNISGSTNPKVMNDLFVNKISSNDKIDIAKNNGQFQQSSLLLSNATKTKAKTIQEENMKMIHPGEINEKSWLDPSFVPEESEASEKPAQRLHHEVNLIFEKKIRFQDLKSTFQDPITGDKDAIEAEREAASKQEEVKALIKMAETKKRVEKQKAKTTSKNLGKEVIAEEINEAEEREEDEDTDDVEEEEDEIEDDVAEEEEDEEDVIGDNNDDGDVPVKISISPSPSDQTTTTTTNQRRISWPTSAHSRIESLYNDDAPPEVRSEREDEGAAELETVKETIKRQILGRTTEHERRDMKLYVVDDQKLAPGQTHSLRKLRAASESQLAYVDRKNDGNGGSEKQKDDESKRRLPPIPESPLMAMAMNERTDDQNISDEKIRPKKKQWNENVYFKTEFIEMEKKREIDEEIKRKNASPNPARIAEKKVSSHLLNDAAKWEQPRGKGRKLMLERLERENQRTLTEAPPMLMYSKTWKDDLKLKLETRRAELRKSCKTVSFDIC